MVASICVDVRIPEPKLFGRGSGTWHGSSERRRGGALWISATVVCSDGQGCEVGSERWNSTRGCGDCGKRAMGVAWSEWEHCVVLALVRLSLGYMKGKSARVGEARAALPLH
jgi:hypothetical protein